MSVGVYVVHHPARDEILPLLLERLGEPVHVVTDPQPDRRNAWANWRRALRQASESDYEHALILENDITPCTDFLAAVRVCVTVRPRDVIRYYHPSDAYGVSTWREVQVRGEHWFPIFGPWGCVQAVSLPTRQIPDFLAFAKTKVARKTNLPDVRLCRWLRSMRRPVWTTVPSLVRHGWPSLCGQPHHDTPPELWVGDGVSALSIDWTR